MKENQLMITVDPDGIIRIETIDGGTSYEDLDFAIDAAYDWADNQLDNMTDDHK